MNLCSDLQVRAYGGNVRTDVKSLTFSCDLLLRSILTMIEKEQNGENISDELNTIKNNLLCAYAHLTGESAENIAKRYSLLL